MFTHLLSPGGFSVIQLNIIADTTDYDIFVAAGSPVYPVDVRLTLASGIYIRSTDSLKAALSTGTGWHAASTLNFVNDGVVLAKGGTGGTGGSAGYSGTVYATAPTVGGDGGAAIELLHDLTVDNTNGNVFGGGGGGGGGGSFALIVGGTTEVYHGGGGGGSGQGETPTVGGAGGIGNNSNVTGGTDSYGNGTIGGTGNEAGPGAGGAGYDYGGGAGGIGGATATVGGAGGSGAASCSGSCAKSYGAAGGGAGKAVDLNSKVITWLAGNNGTQVKGAQT